MPHKVAEDTHSHEKVQRAGHKRCPIGLVLFRFTDPADSVNHMRRIVRGKKMTQYASDPEKRWNRKNYDEGKLRNLELRDLCELETGRDLDKPLEQLVCDVHEETNNPNRKALDNIAHAQKRMVSMMARIAKSNEKLTWWIIGLTGLTFLLTVFSVIIAYRNSPSK